MRGSRVKKLKSFDNPNPGRRNGGKQKATKSAALAALDAMEAELDQQESTH